MSEKAVLSENPAQTSQVNSKPLQTETEVFAVYGAEPEVQAYAMAKYSRSALSMKESLKELNDQKAEKFLNTFYFQYGHRSIADLAHVALAVEKLSLLAAIALVDEQRWDGQERSTRYQNFQKSGYYTPDFGGNVAAAELYQDAIADLFQHYRSLSETVFQFLASRTPKPEDMKQDAYERTLRARAFDITRYLLPLATNTSLGEIVNARTLETQVSRLLSDPHEEIRRLGELLKRAASQPAWNLNQDRYRDLVSRLREKDEALANEAGDLLLKDVRVSPTLVKYAEPNAYQIDARRELTAAATEVMAGEAIESAKLVDLLEDEPLEIELATTLLYEHCHYPYRQIRRKVEALADKRRAEIIDIGIRLAWTPRRVAARVLFRPEIPLRHPHGHWRIPRHAPSPPLRADRAGLHDAARFRHAGRNPGSRRRRRIHAGDAARGRSLLASPIAARRRRERRKKNPNT